jgi:hypothetical protein
MHGSGSVPGIAESFSELVDVGATHVALVVEWSQRDVAATRIAPSKKTAEDEHVRRAIRAARAAGLKVLLFPILQLKKTKPGQWRGTIRPKDVDAWWTSYEGFVLHYAAIAAAEHAEVFSLGSELGTTEAWRYRWYHLISRVEKLYDGELIYSANWDHFRGVSFWRRVDYLGVTGYFELTENRSASTADLRAGWAKPRAALRTFAGEHRKPLWLTEVGYASRDGAGAHPWDYTGRGKLDLEEQRRCYAALRDAWSGIAELGGLFIWNWHGPGGRRDRDYTPRGKPAEKILRDWWSR